MEHDPRSQLSKPQWFAPMPTAWTRFWRTFIPWQLVRFALLNIKMTRIILASHGKH